MKKVIVAAVAGMIAFHWPHVTVLTIGRLRRGDRRPWGAAVDSALSHGGSGSMLAGAAIGAASGAVIGAATAPQPGPRGARARARITIRRGLRRILLLLTSVRRYWPRPRV